MPNVLTQDLVSSTWDDWKRRADDMMAGLQQQSATIAEEARRTAAGLMTPNPMTEPAAPPSPPPPQVAPEDWSNWQQLANQPTPTPPPTTPASPQQDAWQQWQQLASQPLTSLIGQQQPTTTQPSLAHSEEPATSTDQVMAGGPDIGGRWKTQFDFGQTYTGNYRTGTPHRGVDLVPSSGGGIGSEVDAFTPGTVTNISRDSGAGGLMVYVQDEGGLTHAYMHLADVAPGLQVGQRVTRGQPIALMGESGTEGSPHLHYEVRKNASSGDPLDQLIDPRPYMTGQGRQTQTGVQTTAGLSGGGTQSGVVDDRGKAILDGAAQIASWLGPDAQKAVQSILVTEGGLNNARGDSGQSAGPLQFFEGGQLANFAKAVGMTLQDAKTYVEQHPLEAIQWAIGTPTNPGYLGAAIARGIANNYTGAELATYAQRNGQVSVSPERAGQNFDLLFGKGQDLITAGNDLFQRMSQQGQDIGQRLGQTGQSLLDQTQSLLNQARPTTDDRTFQQTLDALLNPVRQAAEERGFTSPFTQMQPMLDQFGVSEADRAMRRQAIGGALEQAPFIGDMIRSSQSLPTPTTGPSGEPNLGISPLLRGPLLQSDQELLSGVSPERLAIARRIATGSGPIQQEPTAGEVANVLRALNIGEAVAMTHQPTSSQVPRVPGGVEPPPVTVPMTRVYHGTTREFDNVRTDLPAVEGENSLGPGYYVTPNPDYASMYARDWRPHYEEPSLVGGNVRAIDMPSDLKFFDLQSVDDVAPEALSRLIQVVRPRDAERARMLESLRQTVVDLGGDSELASPQQLWRFLTSGRNALSVTEANRLIEQAGYNGIRGGDEGTVVFGSSVDKLRNAISGRQGGASQLGYAAGLAGIAGLSGLAAQSEDVRSAFGSLRDRAGDILGQIGELPGLSEADRAVRRQAIEQSPLGQLYGSEVRQQLLPNWDEFIARNTTPEGELRMSPESMMTIGGLVGGVGGPGARAIEQDVRSWLRAQTPLQSTATTQKLTPAQWVANWISSNLLVSPASLAWNSISQSGHLLWQPLMRTLEGHPDEAADAFRTMLMSAPEALRRAGDVLTKGTPYAGVGGQQGQIVSKWFPGLRGNLAGDALFRSLNETMGGVLEAQRLVRDAGAQTPQAMQSVVAQNASRIADVAQREGLASAFMSPGQKSSPLVEGLSRWKQDLLTNSDPNKAKQAAAQILGVLVHQAIPFARMPEAILSRVLRRFPGIGNAIDVFQVIKPPAGANQAQLRASAMANGAITASLIGAYLAGNIRGADDPERPGQIQVAGQWLPMQSLGIIGGQAAMVASIMDAWRKAQNLPADSGVETILNGIGQAANSAGKLAAQDWPMADTFKLLNLITEGNLSQAGTQLASNLIGGLTPLSGALGAAENLVNPISRQVERSGARGIVEPTLSRIPGLSGLLPAQINTATGLPQIRPSSGPGSLLRLQNEPIPAVESELARLNRAGFSEIKAPSKTLPKERTVYGVKIPISTVQAQQIQTARGRIIGAYGSVVNNPGYQRMSDEQKAMYWHQILQMANQVGDVVGDAVAVQTPDLGRQLASRQRVAGRLASTLQRQQALDVQQAAGGRA